MSIMPRIAEVRTFVQVQRIHLVTNQCLCANFSKQAWRGLPRQPADVHDHKHFSAKSLGSIRHGEPPIGDVGGTWVAGLVMVARGPIDRSSSQLAYGR